MAVILADAINPNLLQTLEHTPALIHAGPSGTSLPVTPQLSLTTLAWNTPTT